MSSPTGGSAWPALTTRYRFDHDVLLPGREGPGSHVPSDRLSPRVRHGVARHRARRRTSARRRTAPFAPPRCSTISAPASRRRRRRCRRRCGSRRWRRCRSPARVGWLLVVGRGPAAPRSADRSHVRRDALPDPLARGDRLLARRHAARRRRRPGAPRRRGRHQHPRRSAGRAQLRRGERVRAGAPAHAPRRGGRQPDRRSSAASSTMCSATRAS